MKKVILCNHTGSFNRGCDAIVQSTAMALKNQQIDCILAEHREIEDSKFGFESFSEIVNYSEFSNDPIRRLGSLLFDKVFKKEYIAASLRQRNVWKKLEGNIALNVGGDTYCYGRHVPSICLNKYCNSKNIPSIFWGCSIEKNAIEDEEVWEDLNAYTMIFPRESLTYNYLIQAGYPKEKLYLTADTAFMLPKQEVKLPENFKLKNTVGINLSPLVMSLSSSSDLLINNYCHLIDYVLNETDMTVALIPHVYRERNYDFEDLSALSSIKDRYKNESRVILIDDFYNSKQMKYIISQCRFLVAARTHASIAGYSSHVPTLVLGYSIKARGIAIDLFGTIENYVIPVQGIKSSEETIGAFKYLVNHENEIISILNKKVPEFQEKIKYAAKIIKSYI